MDTSLRIAFADGEYLFALGLKQINEIQNRTGLGIGAVYARLSKGRFFRKTDMGEIAFGDGMQGDYNMDDILSVIRQGLIGGNFGLVDGEEVKVDANRAQQLIDNYVLAEGRPLEDAWTLAHSILSARIVGFEAPGGADLDKKKAETTAA